MNNNEQNSYNQQSEEQNLPESGRAQVLKRKGQLQESEETFLDTPKTPKSFWENFWYHYKWRTIIISFVAIFLLVGTVQLLTKEKPDVYIMYCGPSYINPDVNDGVRSAVRQVMDDYNGDGEKGILLTDITYMNEDQIREAYEIAEEEGVEIAIDPTAQYNAYQKFSAEIFAGESVICLLDPALYQTVKEADGLLKLQDVFGEAWETLVPEEIRVNDDGILLSETKFAKYFTAFAGVREDTVLCIRRVSTMGVFKGMKKTERIHEYHVQLFRDIVLFDYPEGYTPPESVSQGETAES